MKPPPANPSDGMAPIGSMNDVIELLRAFNTAPDGSEAKAMGMMFLHGPGIIVELPSAQDSIAQVMVTVVDEQMAWPVLSRLCRSHQLVMVDPDSGRTFGGAG